MVEKILVVDDDRSMIRLLEYVLGKKGYNVSSASNGLLALKMAHEEEPDLIILDVMLPGMDGFNTCERLRCGLKTSEVPIVMLSSKGHDSDKAVAASYGANVYLTKPVDSDELLREVEGLLDRGLVEEKRRSSA